MPSKNKDTYKKRVKEYEAEYVAKKAAGPLPRSEHTTVSQQRRNVGLPESNDSTLKAQEKARRRVVGTTAPRTRR